MPPPTLPARPDTNAAPAPPPDCVGTYAANLHGCHVEMRVLASLVADKLPRVSKHLDALGCEMSILATDWFLCLFCNNLPAEGACRVLDALFFEGSKVPARTRIHTHG